MLTIMIALLLAPSPSMGPDISVLSRPLNSAAMTSLLVSVQRDHDYDALYYTVEMEVLPELQEIEGTTGILFTPTSSGLDEILLDLRQLAVDSVWDSSGPLTWSHQGDSLTITLDSPMNPGDTSEVFVSYSGTPWNEGAGGWGGFWFHAYVYYHMGVGVYSDQPSLGRVLFPCWDHPADKAGIDMLVTVSDTLYAVAGGDLQSVTSSTDGTTTYHWSQPQPMSTYLAAVAVSDYTVLQDSTIDWIYYYVYPWEVDDALGSYVNVDLMMDRFETVYGPYPWDSKFSYVMTPKGDMEHLTQVYHIAGAVNGFTTYDWLLAHEMSHHWWGDCVTETVWSDVWLSEGFATYSEAVWFESYGQSEYDEYIRDDIMIPYLNSGELFPLAGPSTPSELWSYTTYQKGASILHMLRHIVGETAFWNALHDYFDEFGYGNCSTDDFRDHVELAYGADIDWFFDTWVWDWGYPIYDLEYSWVETDGDWNVTVGLEQTQTVGPTVFTMPLEFAINGASADTLVFMWNDQAVQSGVFTVPFEPVEVVFDPGNYVLSTHLTGIEDTPLPPPGGAGALYFTPNPACSATLLNWSGMDGSDLTVRIFDLAGRLHSEMTLATGERQMDLSSVPPGLYLVLAGGPGNIRQTAKLLVR